MTEIEIVQMAVQAIVFWSFAEIVLSTTKFKHVMMGIKLVVTDAALHVF